MPVSNAVDHVVTKAGTGISVGVVGRRWVPRGDRTVTHHAGWTRVLTAGEGRPPSTAEYFGHAASVSVSRVGMARVLSPSLLSSERWGLPS